MTFPSTLSSYQRLLIHEVAENYSDNIEHSSIGEKELRTVVVRKKSTSTVEDEEKEEENEEKGTEEEDEDEDEDEDKIEEEKEQENKEDGEEEEESNITQNDLAKLRQKLHQKYLETKEKKVTEVDSVATSFLPQTTNKQNRAKAKKGKNKKKANKPSISNANMSTYRPDEGKKEKDMTEEELLRRFDRNKCAYQKCGKGVTVLGQVCTFCKLKYCLPHSMPEVHGCGADAKQKAREDWLRQHQQQHHQNTTKKPEKREALQKRLEQKKEEVARKSKKPPANKTATGTGTTGGRGRGSSRGGRGRGRGSS
ncbi:Efa-6p [Balamuthia mandrillaris]